MNIPTFHDLRRSLIPVFQEAMENTEKLDTDDFDSVHEYLHMLQGHIEACQIFTVAASLHLHKLHNMEALP